MTTNDDVLARIQRLEDIEEIRNLKHKYFRSIDTADMESLKSTLTEDFIADYEGGSYHWHVEGRANFLEAIANSFNSQVVGCHTGHHPEITVLSPSKAEGIWYLYDIFMNFRTMRITTGSAIYRDTYIKTGGKWLTKIATYKRVFEQDEPIEKLPNLLTHQLAKTGRVLAAE